MNMRQGARDANEESARAAQARARTAQAQALGEAVGGLAAFIATINRLDERLAAIEAALGVRGIGSVPPFDLDLDSNADSGHQAGRSGGGVRTEPGDAS